jgi:chloramphenicol 3-O phosphotransferase
VQLSTALAGTVIILNGPPQAGKSSIAAAAQSLADQPYWTLGVDDLFGRMLPTEAANRGLAEADYRAMRGLHAAVAGMARSGCSMLVDYTLLDPAWAQELQAFLEGLDLVWVNVECPAETLQAREQAAGPRPEGAAAALAAAICPAGAALSLDGTQPAEESARRLLDFLERRPMRGQPRARWVPRALPMAAPHPGTAILMVGSTSAGKTTLCRTVQALAQELYFQFGDDTQIDTLAHRFMGIPLTAAEVAGYQPSADARQGMYLVPPGPSDENPTPFLRFQLGPVGRLSLSGTYGAVAALARAGLNVVSDQIFIFPDFYEELTALLDGLPALWVSVCPSLEALEAHERERGDRLPGFARGQVEQMLKNVPCHLTVDSGRLAPDEEARRILAWVEG